MAMAPVLRAVAKEMGVNQTLVSQTPALLGVVEGWLEEKGRYAVRLEDKKRKKAANLRPENCRADVLAL